MALLIKQERIGKNGVPFTICKFRTMKKGSEKTNAFVDKYVGGDDPRLTKAGKVMRRFGIDELPQIWNLLKGDMKLVGPRALLSRDWEILNNDKNEDWGKLKSVTPGFIGSGYTKKAKDFLGARKLELEYVQKREAGSPFWVDAQTFFKVIYNILSGRVKNP